jgi:putative transcription factor
MSDWDSVTRIGSRAGIVHSTTAKRESQVNAARREGGVLGTEKKFNGGSNKPHDTEGQRFAKVDRENEVAPPPKLDMAVGKVIGRARLEKGLKQSELAQKVNEKPNIIQDYEQGRVIPNQQILGKLERALGIKLRGSNIGSKLGK